MIGFLSCPCALICLARSISGETSTSARTLSILYTTRNLIQVIGPPHSMTLARPVLPTSSIPSTFVSPITSRSKEPLWPPKHHYNPHKNAQAHPQSNPTMHRRSNSNTMPSECNRVYPWPWFLYCFFTVSVVESDENVQDAGSTRSEANVSKNESKYRWNQQRSIYS